MTRALVSLRRRILARLGATCCNLGRHPSRCKDHIQEGFLWRLGCPVDAHA
jgi:hypothetical protein